MRYILPLLALILASCCQSHIRTDQYTWAVGHDAELLKAALKKYDRWYADIKNDLKNDEDRNAPYSQSPRPTKLEVAPSGRKIHMTFSDNSQKNLDIDDFDSTFSLHLFAAGSFKKNPKKGTASGWGVSGSITLSKSDI